jgi:hypothetical protein
MKMKKTKRGFIASYSGFKAFGLTQELASSKLIKLMRGK